MLLSVSGKLYRAFVETSVHLPEAAGYRTIASIHLPSKFFGASCFTGYEKQSPLAANTQLPVPMNTYSPSRHPTYKSYTSPTPFAASLPVAPHPSPSFNPSNSTASFPNTRRTPTHRHRIQTEPPVAYNNDREVQDEFQNALQNALTESMRVHFRVVDCATLSFEEQVALAQDTDYLIGAHRAAFVHMLYLRREPVL
ncbi:hypothetical protein BC830DRAFT_1188523 [Chytriomyces sp. MP71]|nr:hypothetical protein BC830DRAFT_1188523 [Chytriomyces sp. MP71]